MLIRIALVFFAILAVATDANAVEPIKIGVVNMLTGPLAEGGSFR